MKTIPKEKLDAAIDITRKYYRNGEPEETLECAWNSYTALEKATGSPRTAWSSLFAAIFPGYTGLNGSATNEDIYAVVRALGFEISA